MSEVGTRPVPPGLSEREVDEAIARLTTELGPEKVLTSPEDLREFRDPFQVTTSDAFLASAVVMPTTVEEIQAVVAIANETKVPLWTHGQGRNNGYGGPAPRVSGSIIVSLRNMNRILEINEKLGYAVVEPGVRWFDLYEAIKAGGHKLMVSIADLGWGSVIGNSLDNGATYMPYGVDQASWCGMEVVLANGERHAHRHGRDASQQGLALLQAQPRPLGGPAVHAVQLRDRHEDGLLAHARARDLHAALAPAPEGRRPRDGHRGHAHAHARRHPAHEPADHERDAARRGALRPPGALGRPRRPSPRTSSTRWRRSSGPAAGSCASRSTGTKPSSTTASRRSRTRSSPRSPARTVWGTKYTPDQIADIQDPSERVQGGVPSLDLNAMTGWYGGEQGGHIGFSPVLPMTGEDALAVRDIMRREMEASGLDYMAALIPINARSMVHVTMVIFDTASVEQSEKAYAACRRAVLEAAKAGTASTARTWTSWTLPPSSTPSATTPSDASTRRSRMRWIQRDPVARKAEHLAGPDARAAGLLERRGCNMS